MLIWEMKKLIKNENLSTQNKRNYYLKFEISSKNLKEILCLIQQFFENILPHYNLQSSKGIRKNKLILISKLFIFYQKTFFE